MANSISPEMIQINNFLTSPCLGLAFFFFPIREKIEMLSQGNFLT